VFAIALVSTSSEGGGGKLPGLRANTMMQFALVPVSVTCVKRVFVRYHMCSRLKYTYMQFLW